MIYDIRYQGAISDNYLAVAALEAFTNCLLDGDNKHSVLSSIKQLEQICKDIK